MTITGLRSQHHAEITQVAIGHGERQHEHIVVCVRLEPHGEVPDVGGGVTEHEQGDEDEPEAAETQGQVLAEPLGPRQLDKGGQNPSHRVNILREDLS